MGLPSQPPLKKKKFNTVHNLITFSIVFTKKNFFFFRPKNLMNLYSKTFYILNFQKKKNHGKVNPKLGVYRWVSGFGQGGDFW